MGSLQTGGSAFSTFFQVAPRLVKVVRQMRPTWHMRQLADLDAAFLERYGVLGLIWDVDGTLTGDRHAALLPEADGPFRALLALPGLRHAILSNAGEERFRQLGTMIPEVPVLRAYQLGDRRLFRKLVGTEDSWTAQDLAARLAEGARVIRKPSAALAAYAVRELGIERHRALMIGDQYMTDVAGANLGGVKSVKLPTLAPETFRLSVKFSQRLELLLYRLLYGRAEWYEPGVEAGA